MFFSITLYLSLCLFGIGLFYKTASWFRCRVGEQARAISSSERIRQALLGILSTAVSFKFFHLLKGFFLEVLLQNRLFKESPLRWAAHMALSYGFLLLLLMHALDRHLTLKLFPTYASTVNPFLFLRNLFGLMMLAGLGLAVYRRASDRVMRLTSRGTDYYALAVLLIIVLSGFLLEAAKIVSHTRYQEMVADYAALSGEEEAAALKAYWAEEFGVVFPRPLPALTPKTRQQGKQLHELNCAACHSKPAAAFLSYGLARAIRPAALTLTEINAGRLLWQVHFLACFVGLALLPFSKFFHILTSPLILLINSVMDRSRASAANIATVRAIELDACTHCATCTEHCSVLPIYRAIPNPTLLPSEKLSAFRSIVSGRRRDPMTLAHFQEGASICTGCFRGTLFCPVGIVAQELWFCMREDLVHAGCPDLFVATRDYFTGRFQEDKGLPLKALTSQGKQFKGLLGLSLQGSTFSSCFTCMTCTNACPVVMNYRNPIEALGLLPHQIMHSLNIALQESTLGARMVWDCLGCYNCQEACPQGVRVTEILYELKNIAFQKKKDQERREGQARSRVEAGV